MAKRAVKKQVTKADFEVTHVEVEYVIGPKGSHNGAFGVKWETKGAGGGSVRFALVNGKLECQNEMMDKNFVKEVLAKMIDDAIFTETAEALVR